MNPTTDSPTGKRESPPGDKQADAKDTKTPNTDMQPEDAGTADSGNEAPTAERDAQGRVNSNDSKQ